MSDGWKKRKKAVEDDYFRKQEEAALKQMSSDKDAKPSPITGKPMKIVDYHGVEIDVCEESGGIWLDKGELEKIITAISEDKNDERTWFENLMENLGFSED